MASNVTENASTDEREEPTFLAGLLGETFLSSPLLRRFMALSPEWRVALGVATLAALIFLPYLGAVGLWDCWEPHYGEVARQMIQRNDYVLPWWESAWFFSKPPLTMWMTALGMQIVGTNRAGPGPVALYTEWGMRLPIALYSIGALSLMAWALVRTASKRIALAFGVVLATMPLYFLLSRQAVTDLPVVASVMCALACALVGQLDEKTKHRSAWWYGFYVFCGLGVLAKELIGVAFPAATLLAYAALCVIPWDQKSLSAHGQWLFSKAYRAKVRAGEVPMPTLWAQMFKMRLGTGILVFLATCGPWYALLFQTTGVDDENERFWFRVIFHDNFNRLAEGVHTTTPGGNFAYFLIQGGYAIFPWVVLVPAVIALVSRLKLRQLAKKEHVAVIALMWTLISFYVVASSATKFHHYIFPALPGLAILIAFAIDKLWEEGIPQHAAALILGGMFFVLVGKDLAENPKNFTDLFVYNYDRPYPTFLDTRTVTLSDHHPLFLGHLLAAFLIACGLYIGVEAFGRKERALAAKLSGVTLGLVGFALLLATANPTSVSALLALGVAALCVGLYLGVEALRSRAQKLPWMGSLAEAGVAAAVGVGLCVAGRTGPAADPLLRALTDPMNVKDGMGFAFGVATLLGAVALIQRSKLMLYGVFLALAVSFSGWYSWSHWVDLSHHWTQRDLFWRYYAQRGSPDEPIAAFLMNWRGETFYSRNEVKQYRSVDSKGTAAVRAFADQPGTKWMLVEHNRVGMLQTAIGQGHPIRLIDRDLNNKFVLVRVE